MAAPSSGQTGSVSQPAATVDAAGRERFRASAAISQAHASTSGAGSVPSEGIVGSAEVTQPAASVAASGDQAVLGRSYIQRRGFIGHRPDAISARGAAVQPSATARGRGAVTQLPVIVPITGVGAVEHPVADVGTRGGLRVLGGGRQQQSAATVAAEGRQLFVEDADNDESVVILDLLLAA
jgi:hypothetical protein